MPLLAAMTATLQIGVKKTKQLATGELVASGATLFDYTGASSYPCRFFDKAINPIATPVGQIVVAETVVLTPASTPIQPLALNTTDSERGQIKITEPNATVTTWEVLSCRVLGNLGKVKEVRLKRWAGE